jgi:hypothetical protein
MAAMSKGLLLLVGGRSFFTALPVLEPAHVKGGITMSNGEKNGTALEGLRKDALSGDYRVQPGYEYQAHRFRIHETYLDEDDNLFVQASAVERKSREGETKSN